MILIGSQALRFNMEKIGGVYPSRDGRPDLDFFAYVGEAYEFVRNSKMEVTVNDGNKIVGKLPDGMMCEIEIGRIGSSTHLYLMWAELYSKLNSLPLYGTEVEIAPLEMLFSIKKAHRHSPRKFSKHVKDYNFLRVLTKDIFPKITSLRYAETKQRDKLFTPSLKKSKSEFFDDSVSNKTFIHDEIHEVMAFGEHPMFEKIRISSETVACSVDKWNSLEPLEKIQCVQEEAYVIALERAVIPMLFEGGPIAVPFDAYKWAVMRICTTLTSGWFREWALENYQSIIWAYDKEYVGKFLKAVEDGEIKRINSETIGSAKPNSVEADAGSGAIDQSVADPVKESSTSVVREESSESDNRRAVEAGASSGLLD